MQLLQFSCSAVRSVFSCGPPSPAPPLLPPVCGFSSECWGGWGVWVSCSCLFRNGKEILEVAY